jgi:hypothetical protein
MTRRVEIGAATERKRMDDLLKQHPELTGYLDPTPGLENRASHVVRNGREYLIVRQVSEFEGGMLAFERIDGAFRPTMADKLFELGHVGRDFDISSLSRNCGPGPADDHSKVAALSEAQVGHFSSHNGPDGGNLACVWAVRHIAFEALGRWITATDGTAVFYPELRGCMGASPGQEQVPAGGIVISPTRTRPNGTRNVGHVGLLGPVVASADSRLIYSNSSAQALWKQNFTLKSWRQRYVEQKGLEMHFYKLPFRPAAPTS